MDYENASDFEINKAVAEALGKFEYVSDHNFEGGSAVLCDSLRACDEYDYCNDPRDAWPIIVENEISIEKNSRNTEYWRAATWEQINGCEFKPIEQYADKNPLRAAMICYLMLVGEKKQ